jgi:hypothetical protein
VRQTIYKTLRAERTELWETGKLLRIKTNNTIQKLVNKDKKDERVSRNLLQFQIPMSINRIESVEKT